MNTRTTRMMACLLLVALFVCVQGCTVGPDYQRPEIPLPQEFKSAELDSAFSEQASPHEDWSSEWWRSFDDPVLTALVAKAREDSLDIRIAFARITESRALLGVDRADLFPNIDATGSYERNQNSQELDGGFQMDRITTTHAIGLGATWELDLWGRVRRSVEAAEAELSASVEDARAVLVSVTADTALAYVDLRAAERRLLIAQRNIALQADTVSLTRDQFDAGIVSELDLAQSQTLLASTESTLPDLFTLMTNAENRLAVLTGLRPGSREFDQLLNRNGANQTDISENERIPGNLIAQIPASSASFAIGIPADLLRRRPDIRRAERDLAAATARIGVATGDLYPRFMLGGSIGYEAEQSADLFNNQASVFGFGPSFSWNLFNAGRIRSLINAQDARTESALASYEQTILVALEDVENALTGLVRSRTTVDALDRAVGYSRRTVELADDQYRQGLVSFQSVLDSQSRLFDLEDNLVATQARTTSSLIALYRALGGGWENPQPKQNDPTQEHPQ